MIGAIVGSSLLFILFSVCKQIAGAVSLSKEWLEPSYGPYVKQAARKCLDEFSPTHTLAKVNSYLWWRHIKNARSSDENANLSSLKTFFHRKSVQSQFDAELCALIFFSLVSFILNRRSPGLSHSNYCFCSYPSYENLAKYDCSFFLLLKLFAIWSWWGQISIIIQ